MPGSAGCKYCTRESRSRPAIPSCASAVKLFTFQGYLGKGDGKKTPALDRNRMSMKYRTRRHDENPISTKPYE